MQSLVQKWPTEPSASEDEDNEYLQFASVPCTLRPSKETHDRHLSLPTLPAGKIDRQRAPSPPQNANISLTALRRVHAEEMVAKQKAKTEKILRARGGSLAQNEAYVSDLLSRRLQFYSTVNEKLSEVFRGISSKALDIKNSVERERRRKSLKLAVADMERQEQDFTVLEPILELFTSTSDPMAVLVREFITRCRQLLRQAGLERDPGVLLEKVLDEIIAVEYHISEVLIGTFEDLANPDLKVSVKLSVQNFFFTTALSPAIQSQIRRHCAQEDSTILDKFLLCSWEELFGRLNIRGKLQIPRDKPLDTFPINDAGIYSKAISELQAISTQVTPLDKLLCLTRCCNAICQAVDDARREVSEERPEAVGSEDLLMLMAYVLVRASVPDLASQMMFISKFVPDELIRGEAGYVLATTQTAMDYALGKL
jgi:hypothetical protein